MSRGADLTACLFDVGGVLIHPDPRTLGDLVECHIGRRPSDGALKQAIPRVVRDLALARRGWDDERVVGAGFARALACSRSQGRDLWRAIQRLDLTEGLWTVVDRNAFQTLGRLRDEGTRLGAVSNAQGNTGRRLADHELDQFFDAIVDSRVAGHAKPDRRIFRLAAARLGRSPRECAYVGDDPAADIEGAQGAGYGLAVLYDPCHLHEAEACPATIRSLRDLPSLLAPCTHDPASS
jgi:HAD superfamily hydrolase (TIGR01509 family)